MASCYDTIQFGYECDVSVDWQHSIDVEVKVKRNIWFLFLECEYVDICHDYKYLQRWKFYSKIFQKLLKNL